MASAYVLGRSVIIGVHSVPHGLQAMTAANAVANASAASLITSAKRPAAKGRAKAPKKACINGRLTAPNGPPAAVAAPDVVQVEAAAGYDIDHVQDDDEAVHLKVIVGATRDMPRPTLCLRRRLGDGVMLLSDACSHHIKLT